MIKVIKITSKWKNPQLVIGRIGEHHVTAIEADLSEYVEQYGMLNASCIASTSMYTEGFPVVSEWDSDTAILTIPVTETLTMYPRLYLEIRMVTAEGLAKSEPIKLICLDALKDGAEAPEPVKAWLEKAQEILRNLEENGVDTDTIAKALADYLEEHPIEAGLTEDEVKAIVGQSLDGKADKEHTHSASDVYFGGNYEGVSVATGFGQVVDTLTEIGTALGNKSDIGHNHDDRYASASHNHDGMYVQMGQYADDMFGTQLSDWNIEYGAIVDFEEIWAWASGANGRSRNVRVFDMELMQYAIMSRVEYVGEMPYLVWANDFARYRLSATGEWSREEIPQPVSDAHINSLIDAKLTPIESLVDEISEVVG